MSTSQWSPKPCSGRPTGKTHRTRQTVVLMADFYCSDTVRPHSWARRGKSSGGIWSTQSALFPQQCVCVRPGRPLRNSVPEMTSGHMDAYLRSCPAHTKTLAF